MLALSPFSALFLAFTAFSFVSSLPLDNGVATIQHMHASKTDHPAIADYQYVEGQLQVVITEIKAFNAVRPQTETFYRHTMETIESLRKANEELLNGPDLGFFDWTGFAPTLASLWIKIHQLAWAIEDKKSDINATKTNLVFYTLAKQAYKESVHMQEVLAKKQPGFVSTITSPLISEAVGKLKEIRDTFGPKDGDLEVVVVTAPENGEQPQQSQGDTPPWQQQPSQGYKSPQQSYQTQLNPQTSPQGLQSAQPITGFPSNPNAYQQNHSIMP
jgi:hypothetical protein